MIIKRSDLEELTNVILGDVFPFLISFGTIGSAGQFALGMVIEREDKTRHLLNFAGMSSSAYCLSYLFAEYVIYSVPQVLLIITVYFLEIKAITDHVYLFFLSTMMFGLPFVSMMHIVSHFFSTLESALKYSTTPVFWMFIILTIVQSFTEWEVGLNLIYPPLNLSACMYDILGQ